jgi:NADPH:quinone reductase-like Zn-dependent oxidoreductase
MAAALTRLGELRRADFVERCEARERARSAPMRSSTSEGDVASAVKDATGGGPDVVVEHVGAETSKTSLAVARFGGRVVVCGATTGANTPAQLHRSGGSS